MKSLYLANCTDGGDGANNFSDETKRKLSKHRKGKKINEIIGDEKANKRKLMLTENWSGENNPNYVNINPDDILIKLIDGKNNIEIAKEFNVSPATIIEKFKKKFKCTPNKYIKKLQNEKVSNNTKDSGN